MRLQMVRRTQVLPAAAVITWTGLFLSLPQNCAGERQVTLKWARQAIGFRRTD